MFEYLSVQMTIFSLVLFSTSIPPKKYLMRGEKKIQIWIWILYKVLGEMFLQLPYTEAVSDSRPMCSLNVLIVTFNVT